MVFDSAVVYIHWREAKIEENEPLRFWLFLTFGTIQTITIIIAARIIMPLRSLPSPRHLRLLDQIYHMKTRSTRWAYPITWVLKNLVHLISLNWIPAIWEIIEALVGVCGHAKGTLSDRSGFRIICPVEEVRRPSESTSITNISCPDGKPTCPVSTTPFPEVPLAIE